ncbi:hypothetical protein MJO29_014154, partial [Puccinia striiformis f. sp. tritici]
TITILLLPLFVLVESNRPTISISCSPTIEIRLGFPRSTTTFNSTHCLSLIQPPLFHIQPPPSSSFGHYHFCLGLFYPAGWQAFSLLVLTPTYPTPDFLAFLIIRSSTFVPIYLYLTHDHTQAIILFDFLNQSPLTSFPMAKGRKIDPFTHETRREKNTNRDSASQQTLASLVAGTYQPPRIGNHPRPSTSSFGSNSSGGDVGNTYQYHDHQHPDHYGPDQDNGDHDHMLESQSHIAHHGSLAATSALSAWGSIPWDVPSSIPNRSSPEFNFLDPEITAAIRNRDRNASHQRKDDAWQKLMGKLFPVYMWLKVKTQNWTATNALDSFSTKFC